MSKEVTGKAKGGKALAEKMTADQRREKALIMVEAKKVKTAARRALSSMPKVSHRGDLSIGDMTIPCFVLEDGRRILSENGVSSILGTSGGKSYKLRDSATNSDTGPMPLFLASKALQPFIHEAFDGVDLSPIEYADGDKILTGYEANILPKVCEVWLRAKEDGALQPSQHVKAKKAEVLMRGLAHVGIIALVDEATGFQYERPRRELEDQLKKFISDSLRKWVRTFPADYFKHLCRLRNVELKPDMRLPQYFGTLTNNLVYKRLAPGILSRLKEKRIELGKSNGKLHSLLSLDYGFPEILVHLGMVVAVMKQHTDYADFEKALNAIAPIYPDVPGLFDDPKDWD